MAFVKNDKNINRRGRPKRKPDTNITAIREAVMLLYAYNFERLQQALDGMKNEQFYNAMDKLLKHCLPVPENELKQLTTEDIQRIATELRKQYGNEL